MRNYDEGEFLAKRLLFRSFSPYFQNNHGAGQPNTIAKPASREDPPPYPRAVYMAGANNGKPKPASERKHETAANPGRYMKQLEPTKDGMRLV
jgi:hypothetical protein